MVDQPNSRMKVVRTAGTFSILCGGQSWPLLAMHPGFVSGPCSLELRNTFAHSGLIHSSGISCLLHNTSLFRLDICFSKSKDAETNFCTIPFRARGCSHHTRFHACASSSRLPMDSAVPGEHCACSQCLWKAFAPTNHPALSKALSESGAFLAILAARKSLL